MEEAKENISKRTAKGKGKKIDIAALKAKVKEDPELVEKANKRGKGRKKVGEDEEAPPPARPRPGYRVNA
jgi:hypothetical protein